MRILSFLGLIILALTAFAFFAGQPYKVSGVVTDDQGAPLAGVSVTIKGARSGTSTDTDGKFSIMIPSGKAAVLLFSYVGFDTKEVKVNKAVELKVEMKVSSSTLNEVVVTAYGVQRNKKALSYSSTKVSADQLVSPSYYANALTGKIPGVQIYGSRSPQLDGYKQLPQSGQRFGLDDEESGEAYNREGYDHVQENNFKRVGDEPLSTFSIDVDAASYSNVRRYLQMGSLPPAGAVRIEELINYFHYDYPQPTGNDPFSINTELGECPWNKDHQLFLIGLQGKKLPTENLPPSNLVFLIDVSGSMNEPNKLPLVKSSLKLLVDQLREQDKVSLVVYAGAAGIVLPPTSGAEKTRIKVAIDNLNAGGSTAGGEGIKLAYATANQNKVKGSNDRVILCTDGDFNVGVSSDDELERMIENERKSGVYLSVLGFGMGNYQDAKMQKLADKGNGNHSYIDGLNEAKKVFVNEFGGTLFTIAKDVKLQIEFNPNKVAGYRLIGYENRMLNKEDFNDDKKDAGELGSGHTVTALYELIPAGKDDPFLGKVDALKYQKPVKNKTGGDEYMTIKFRYKAPADTTSKLMVHAVKDQAKWFGKFNSNNFNMAAAVAQFGMLLRDSKFMKDANWKSVLTLAKAAKGDDVEGYRTEFIQMAENAKRLSKARPEPEPVEDETGER